MKIGSVQFYKRLILTCIALMIIVPTGLCIHFAVKNSELNREVEALSLIKENIYVDEQWFASAKQTFFLDENKTEYSLEYQELYPDLYVERNEEMFDDVPNSVYLTFDDGPSPVTKDILKVLKEKDVKATFFVVYNDSSEAAELLREIAEEGHTIGVHSTTHIYSQIYSSVEAFLSDFEMTATWIEEVTGNKPEIFRFPGGSINIYNEGIYQTIIAEMLRRGYLYYDWNVDSGDAARFYSKYSIYNNVVKDIDKKDKAIVLFHDSLQKKGTLQALPDIIDSLKASGKTILPLTNQVKPITFSYIN
ncbi:MAG: polysaccharide deacetylase [Clostridiales bacterium]|jgi:peptidoglycan/xylan/chitin deacetylase (PgdA/CDA1 family)|nr:polysaccharide deacetylase [Clostridiales bacterium]